MKQHIQHVPGDETAWICPCGNTPAHEGFAPCGYDGEDMEPTRESGWPGRHRCDRCGRIIDQQDLSVVGIMPQTYRFDWQGITIEATYTPLKWGVTAHLEVQSVNPAKSPLPITATGYRSHFHTPGTVEALGGDVVAQVVAWLDEEASNADWQAYSANQRQLTLF